MKICIVVDNLYEHAGYGRLARRIGKEVTSRGHEVTYVSEFSEDNDGVLTTKLKGFSFRNISKFFSTLIDIRKFVQNKDIIVCFDVKPYGIVVMLATLGMRKKKILYALGTYSLFSGKSTVKDFVMKIAFKSFDEVFIVSEFTKRKIEQYGFSVPNASIVPVGVDVVRFKRANKPLPRVPLPYIVGVGGMKYRKGYHLSLRAFALIAREFPDLTYVIRAHREKDSKNYFNSVKKIITDNNLQDRVIFIEDLDDDQLAQLYSFARFFILTPVSTIQSIEGFGMVYLEAGSCGTPVIGTYDTGAEAAIINDYNGLLSNGNPDDIALAMEKMLADKNLSDRLGRGGIKRSKEFAWSKIADMHIKHYEDLLRQKT